MAADVPLPADDEARLALAQRTGATLVAVAGLLSLAVVPIAAIAEPPRFHGTVVVIVASLAVASAPVVARLRMSWRSMYLAIAAATGLISVGVPAAGASYPLGAVLYLWAVLFGFLFFPRRVAIAITCLVAVEYAVVVAVVDGFAAPVGWWLFLIGTAVVTGVIVDWLVSRARALGETERQARIDLEAAHARLERTSAELSALNRTLEDRVSAQVRELAALGELRRFLSPQVADTVLQEGGSDLLQPHRRDIAVFFCDLRGFTAFTTEVEPEEVLAVLAEYYDCVGSLLHRFRATVGPLSGDGIMAYFNDPVPCSNPSNDAVELALAVQKKVGELSRGWTQRGHDLACGVGVAAGYATLGLIGFEGKRDYGPMGSVVNRASRLCDEAGPGQILVDAAVRRQMNDHIGIEQLPDLHLKGFHRPVPVYAIDPPDTR